MKDIVIIAHFCLDFSESDNSRFSYLGKLLSEENNIEIVTSNFNHSTKTKRERPLAHWPFKITFVSESGYSKNVCLRRFYSHWIFGQNVMRYLESRKKPDVIYCAVPSLDVASVAAHYAKKNHIRFIIDIQDIWPEAFRMVFDVPILSDIIFSPMERKANRIYAAADEIIAVSQTYADRALQINCQCQKATVVFLGTEIARFDELKENKPLLKKPSEEIWMAYIGTLGHSYDITCVLDAMALLRDKKGLSNIRFIIMGDGPLRQKFESHAKGLQLPVVFTGRLTYTEMVPLLNICDFAVNPISQNAAQSIINKVGDYAAAGLPVINTQECLEYRNLVDTYEMGINCENNHVQSLADTIEYMVLNENLRILMGTNNRRLAEERFDRAYTYQALVEQILHKTEKSVL